MAPEAYLVTDGGMIIQESNQAAAAMLKADRAVLSGKPLQHFIAEEDRPGFQANLIQLREGGEKLDWELRLQPEEGALCRRSSMSGPEPTIVTSWCGSCGLLP